MFFVFSDPELFAAFLAGNARPPAASAGEPCHRRHLLRLWFHPVQGSPVILRLGFIIIIILDS